MKLNDNEMKVLQILEEDPYINQKTIAEAMSLSRPAVANLISGLQEKGYILGKPYLLNKEDSIICVGGANIDYTFTLKENLILKTSNPVTPSLSLGGVVRNIAENLARLNNQVSLMSIVGSDSAGENLLKESKKLMEVFATDTLDNQRTGSYYSVIGKNGNLEVGFANMDIYERMDRTWILEHRKYLARSSWIISDCNVKKDGIESLIEFAKDNDKKLVIIGVSGPKVKNIPDDLNGVELLICNLDESQSYFHDDSEDLEYFATKWIDKGVNKIVITRGELGAVYGVKDNIKRQKAVKIITEEIIDVTGAGDAFSAATIHGLINGKTFEKSVKYGVVSSSLTIKIKSAVNPQLSRKLIEKELNKNEEL